MACRIVSSDPEFILMLCMREIEENGEVMKPKEYEGDEMGNNNELRDNGKDGGMDVDRDEGGGMNVDSVPRSDNIPAFDGCSSGITEDISGDKPVDIYQKFITDNMIQLIERDKPLWGSVG